MANTIFVFQTLKAVTGGIIKANCMTHIVNCARLDIETTVNKIILLILLKTHRSSVCNCGRRLSGFTEIRTFKMAIYWPKTCLLSLGEEHCPKLLCKLFKRDQDSEGRPVKLQAYLSFLHNGLKIFNEVVLVLEGEDRTVCELYKMISTLRAKLQQGQLNYFFLEKRPVLSSNSFQTKTRLSANMIFPISTDRLRGSSQEWNECQEQLLDTVVKSSTAMHWRRSCCMVKQKVLI